MFANHYTEDNKCNQLKICIRP